MFKQAIQKLLKGETVEIRPRGNSMRPKIKSGQLVTIEPIKDFGSLKKGEIVLVKVGSNTYVHLISATDKNRVQISNNHGKINGWTQRINVFGRVVKIE